MPDEVFLFDEQNIQILPALDFIYSKKRIKFCCYHNGCWVDIAKNFLMFLISTIYYTSSPCCNYTYYTNLETHFRVLHIPSQSYGSIWVSFHYLILCLQSTFQYRFLFFSLLSAFSLRYLLFWHCINDSTCYRKL